MKKFIPLLIAILFFASCSMQAKLNRNFKGKDKAYLDNYYHQKATVIKLRNSDAVIYNQSKVLRSTEINKGVTTLDPMITPTVKKEEKFIFYLDKDGKVTSSEYYRDYQK